MVTQLWWSSRASAFLAHIETTTSEKLSKKLVVSIHLAKNTQDYSTTKYL
jgi:hypothetical protein